MQKAMLYEETVYEELPGLLCDFLNGAHGDQPLRSICRGKRHL